MRDFCCENCFENIYIKEYIREQGGMGDCSYCGSRDAAACDTEAVGEFVRERFSNAYEELDYLVLREGMAEGSSIDDMLCSGGTIFDEALYDAENTARELLEDLFGEDWDLDGEVYAPRNDLYRGESTAESCAWERFKVTCRYGNRYFDVRPGSSREKLLDTLKRVWEQLEATLCAGSELYRIRGYQLELGMDHELQKLDAYREIGPAPWDRAKNNRMSPTGISYTYLAGDADTCAREAQLKDRGYALMGRFRLKKKLNMVDLSRRNVEAMPELTQDIFEPDYDPNLLWIKDFLRSFAREISRPVTEGDRELEYVPTQLLAEYIRKLGYDGIAYDSSLSESEGKNYVFFFGPVPDKSADWLWMCDELIKPFTEVFDLEEMDYIQVRLAPRVKTLFTRESIRQTEEELAEI